MLRHYDPSLRTIPQTDASDYAMGAVLSQVDENGREWIISFASKSLDPAQRNYAVTEKECLAVVWGTEHFRTLLLGTQFELQTDHQALKWLLTSKEGVGRNARWQLKLQEYDMIVTYKPGNKHLNADFFSRLKRHSSGPYIVKLVGVNFDTITDDEVFQALNNITPTISDSPETAFPDEKIPIPVDTSQTTYLQAVPAQKSSRS